MCFPETSLSFHSISHVGNGRPHKSSRPWAVLTSWIEEPLAFPRTYGKRGCFCWTAVESNAVPT